jgi:hypothetical protein
MSMCNSRELYSTCPRDIAVNMILVLMALLFSPVPQEHYTTITEMGTSVIFQLLGYDDFSSNSSINSNIQRNLCLEVAC